MSRKSHQLTLEEARKMGKLGTFAKHHPATGDWEKFNRLFSAMAHGEPPSPRKKPKAAPTSNDPAGAC